MEQNLLKYLADQEWKQRKQMVGDTAFLWSEHQTWEEDIAET